MRGNLNPGDRAIARFDNSDLRVIPLNRDYWLRVERDLRSSIADSHLDGVFLEL